MKHPREPQNAPEHGRVFRARLEDRNDSSSDDEEEKQGDGDYEAPADDAMEEDGVDPDEAWHTKKGLTCVEIGKCFEVGGREYQRTAKRGAKCTTCEHPFGKHSYNLRALGAHAAKCLSDVAKKAGRALAGTAAAWTGTVSCTHTFDGGHAVTIDFAKVEVDGKNALKCPSCDKELLQTAEHFQKLHVKTHHEPELVNRGDVRVPPHGQQERPRGARREHGRGPTTCARTGTASTRRAPCPRGSRRPSRSTHGRGMHSLSNLNAVARDSTTAPKAPVATWGRGNARGDPLKKSADFGQAMVLG
jgi:putative hemolysin/uncharacterized C2H2 Zn-finger protein